MLGFDIDGLVSDIFNYRIPQSALRYMARFKVSREDIGKTVVFCPVCSYKRVLSEGAVPFACPTVRCIGILQFIDVTREFFDDDEE